MATPRHTHIPTHRIAPLPNSATFFSLLSLSFTVLAKHRTSTEKAALLSVCVYAHISFCLPLSLSFFFFYTRAEKAEYDEKSKTDLNEKVNKQ